MHGMMYIILSQITEAMTGPHRIESYEQVSFHCSNYIVALSHG